MINRLVWLIFGFGVLCMVAAPLKAQNPQKHIREGNKLFEKKDFSNAETSYLKALETDSTFIKGKFNRADALYEQEKFQEAAGIFKNLTVENLEEDDKAAVWHNLGNSLTQSKSYTKAVEAYKEALRQKPDDMDTKYNLTYAMKKLKEQEQQNKDKQQKQDQKQNQDQKKNQDKKQQNQNNEQQQKNDKQQNNNQQQNKKDKPKDQKKNRDQQKQQKQRPQEISGKEAKRMLEALKNNEKETLKKLKRIKAKGDKVETEKDW